VPDYTAVFLPGLVITVVAAGPITGGDPLEVAGTGTVQKCAGAGSAKYVGIAALDAIAGNRLTMFANKPVFDGIAEGTVTAGDQVCASAVAGKQVKTVPASAVDIGASPTVQATANTAINAGLAAVRSIIGVAMTTATDGTTVRWMQK
jgi:hypothetical protein